MTSESEARMRGRRLDDCIRDHFGVSVGPHVDTDRVAVVVELLSARGGLVSQLLPS